ncbi:OLC1v1020914C1 [Oldenlandia corymbosa var. corymbosa]|uniref:Homeobox-leucine zipper protein n=1 Tax=Oldenlandia corymbosa var. corymbosa TaxID=529605 RepID=A0AAV1BUI4_OLDCO|nr:OLC1v1020914C1 [Oldenlandia corymbosa var. corymbosa]
MEETSYCSEHELQDAANNNLSSPSTGRSAQDSFQTPRKKKSDNSINAKRFSHEQVKSLESMFHRGAKLEPKNKLQLAKDLGLQPRQVSIWFQNKRARWKSKKMEQEYGVLKADFDSLSQQYESLKKEHDSLLQQLGRLNSLLENPDRKQSSSSRDCSENAAPVITAELNSEGEDQRHEAEEEEAKMESNMNNREKVYGIIDEDDGGYWNRGTREQLEDQEGECSMMSLSDDQEQDSVGWKVGRKQWCSFVPGGILDDPSCPSSWWDF